MYVKRGSSATFADTTQGLEPDDGNNSQLPAPHASFSLFKVFLCVCKRHIRDQPSLWVTLAEFEITCRVSPPSVGFRWHPGWQRWIFLRKVLIYQLAVSNNNVYALDYVILSSAEVARLRRRFPYLKPLSNI